MARAAQLKAVDLARGLGEAELAPQQGGRPERIAVGLVAAAFQLALGRERLVARDQRVDLGPGVPLRLAEFVGLFGEILVGLMGGGPLALPQVCVATKPE